MASRRTADRCLLPCLVISGCVTRADYCTHRCDEQSLPTGWPANGLTCDCRPLRQRNKSRDSGTVIELAAPSFPQRYFLRTSRDEAARCVSQRGVGIVMADQTWVRALEWIPISGCLLQGPIDVQKDNFAKHNMFISSPYDPTDSCTYKRENVLCDYSVLPA